MSNEKKELIWVSAETAELFNAAESDAKKKALIEKEIARRKFDVASEIEDMEHGILEMENYQLALVEKFSVMSEKRNAQYEEVINQLNDVYSKLNEKNKAINKEIEESQKAVERLDEQIRKVNLYIPDHLARLVESIEYMKGSSLELLKKLFDISIRDDE